MDFEKWQYHEHNLPAAPEDKTAFLEQLKTKFKNDLLASEAASAWLDQFNKSSIEGFIEHYVDLKIQIVRNSKWYIEKAEAIPELKYREETENALEMILQKKLFNQQLRWRAELITLPEIRICHDFDYWVKDIYNCPFIEPVTEVELELLRRYVLTDDFDAEGQKWNVPWQSYSELLEKDSRGLLHNMPDWYDYYDTYMGTGTLLLLSDVRGNKEEHYRDAYFDNKRKLDEGKQSPVHTPITFPTSLYYSLPRFYELACQFDDPYFRVLIEASRNELAYMDSLDGEDENIIRYVRSMEKISDLPPVRGGLTWRQAVRRCYNDYVNGIVHRDLPLVWEEYTMYKSMGIQSSKYAKVNNEFEKSVSDMLLAQILEGRVLLGEPGDLNF